KEKIEKLFSNHPKEDTLVVVAHDPDNRSQAPQRYTVSDFSPTGAAGTTLYEDLIAIGADSLLKTTRLIYWIEVDPPSRTSRLHIDIPDVATATEVKEILRANRNRWPNLKVTAYGLEARRVTLADDFDETVRLSPDILMARKPSQPGTVDQR